MNALEAGVETQRAEPYWPKFALLTLYALVTGIAILSHIMWRDEIQAWLIARDSADPPALFHNLHYEGHAALWYLLLMPLTRLSRDPVLMQVLHFGIATATVAIVLWRAPFSPFERALFPFGYFTFYEYAVKSRGYALGCLLIFLFCALWQRRRHLPVAMAVVLALMANVDILFVILSMAAVLALIVDRLTNESTNGEESHASWRSDLLATVIVCGGWALAIATAMPPSDSGATGWFFGRSSYRVETTLAALSVFFTPSPLIWVSLPAVAILLIALSRIRENPPGATFLGVSVLGLLAFFYTNHPPSEWHRGLILMALFATVWIDRISARSEGASRNALVPAMLFGAVLACQGYAGLMAIWTDLHQPLSRSRDVARFIGAQDWAPDPVIGVPDYTTSPIIGYLGADRAYYPSGRRWGSFVVWDKRRREPVDMERTFEETAQFGTATLVVSAGTHIDRALLVKYGFGEVAQFTGARDPLENYTIYRRPAKAAPGP
jgi:hypothetical protein